MHRYFIDVASMETSSSNANVTASFSDEPPVRADDQKLNPAPAGDDDDPGKISPLIEPPELLHKLQITSSIISLAISDKYIYAGTQSGEILAWSLVTYELLLRVQAHRRAVLCLFLSQDGRLLWSSSGDAISNAWCPTTLRRLYHVYSSYDCGDLFAIAYSCQFKTVYLGAQNTSIQWLSLEDGLTRPVPDEERHPDRRNHRFFDSVAAGGEATPRHFPEGQTASGGLTLEIDKAHVRQYAHFGYVHCMLLVRREEDVLISGGGDGTIKVWKLSIDPDCGIEEIATLGHDDAESVLSMAIDGSFLYAGKLDGIIELWDLETKQKLRVLNAGDGDVMALQMSWGYLWSACSTGFIKKYGTVQYGKYKNGADENVQKHQCLRRWRGHKGKVLAAATTTFGGNSLYISGANDDSVCIWKVSKDWSNPDKEKLVHEDDILIKSLREFVSFQTISSRPNHAEDCRKGASFLRSLFKKHGAQTEMLNTSSHNPIVYARFIGNPARSPNERKKILFYGHYDVVPADDKGNTWICPPFDMRGHNGYLYGRGVSDNKGPILAALFAVVECISEKSLDADVIFLIEGEEESGSRGFKDAIKRNKDLIGGVDYILLANSYWLDDEVPCLTYGLRGVLHATASVRSALPDLHSGVDGSCDLDEPLSDLTAILAKLKGYQNRIEIPGFYQSVLPITEEEDARYNVITETLLSRNPELGTAANLKRSLLSRWTEPNLTIHRYTVSGPEGSLISNFASASISLRLVPNQEVDDVINGLTKFLQAAFMDLDSHNQFSLQIENVADPWLGDPHNEIFRTLEEAILKCWTLGDNRRPSTPRSSRKIEPLSPKLKPVPTTTLTLTQGSDHTSLASSDDLVTKTEQVSSYRRQPLYIREGGSIPSIRFLEKEFDCPAAHLPCGQASDNAHLDNERLRLSNLYKSKDIFKYVFKELPQR